MSAKRTIFPKHASPGAGQDFSGDDDLYMGQPDFSRESGPEPEFGNDPTPQFKAKKGHAAYASPYAAQDEMPPYAPSGGNLGGLLGNVAPEAPSQGAGGEGGLLSVVTDDALAAECAKRICPSCPVKKEAEDSRLRALAELDNAKKRLERERGEQIRFAAEKVLSDIIPSLDNLDLALQHAGASEACKDFVTGVRMTRKLMQEALAKHGLVQVGEVGEEFNPAMHEAVGMLKSPDVPDNHVCALLSNGYMLHDRLLRPARVMVCRG